MRRRRWTLSCLALVLVAGACGGDDSGEALNADAFTPVTSALGCIGGTRQGLRALHGLQAIAPRIMRVNRLPGQGLP